MNAMVPAADGSRWFALLSETGLERRACIWMKRRQLSPYWPRFEARTRIGAHGWRMRWRSAIPGYLFLPLPARIEPPWRVIEQIPGIRDVMRHGDGAPVEMTPADMATIGRIEAALAASEIAARDGIPFRVGERIRISDRLWGTEGHIVKIDSRTRITVEVNLFGRPTLVYLPAAEIEAV